MVAWYINVLLVSEAGDIELLLTDISWSGVISVDLADNRLTPVGPGIFGFSSNLEEKKHKMTEDKGLHKKCLYYCCHHGDLAKIQCGFSRASACVQ